MKKSTIISLALLMLFAVSCKQEQATIYSPINKYAIQDDTNWVEVIDTNHLDFCSHQRGAITAEDAPSYLKYGTLIIINNAAEYQVLLEQLDSIGCSIVNPPNINFEQKTLIGYSIMTGNHSSSAHFYKNNALKKYLYLIEEKLLDNYDWLFTLREWTVVPKIDPSFTVEVDTLLQY